MAVRRFGSLLLPVLLIAGCGGQDGGTPATAWKPGDPGKGGDVPSVAAGPADRNALADVADPFEESVKSIVYLEQNWSPDVAQKFYFTSQGSQILPYNWFLALEQAGDTKLFRDNVNLSKYRYLTQKPGPGNPDGLPVGFVKDEGDKRGWLGLTCAACHTSQVNYGGVGYRIDGGASGSDVRTFLFELTEALKTTRDDDAKFKRFAGQVGKLNGAAADPEAIKDDLSKVIATREAYNTRNFPKDAVTLFGRIDAFGAIMNEVFHAAAKIPPGDPVAANTGKADAPVSIPFLWDTPQHDALQWNGVAKNAGLGSLGRNVGEVLGVFGGLEVPSAPMPVPGFKSTVRVLNLLVLEEELKSLWSPLWPSAFPPIDKAKADRGKAAFVKATCNTCHLDINRTDPFRRIEAQMKPVGTDPTMSRNFSTRIGDTGKIEGAFVKVFPWPPLSPQKFQAKASAEDLLGYAVIQTILGSPYKAPQDELTEIEYKRKLRAVGAAAAVPGLSTGPAYKARPLNGIWATAPYLHNGSVPSLYHLLLSPKDRPKTFTVGSREFDAKNVGFKTDAIGFPTFRARNDDGTPIAGNSNEGHDYGGSSLTDDERWDLVEYLKTL